jgi:hypothetical protein
MCSPAYWYLRPCISVVFDWPDAITWAAIVQAGAAIVICVLTARLATLSQDALVRDARRTERDERLAERVKPAFLRAIDMELGALGSQLDGSILNVNLARRELATGNGHSPHWALALRTAVFSSQLPKLRDVDDPLLIEIIHFYSDLGTLQQVLEGANKMSDEYNSLDPFSTQRSTIQPRLLSVIRVFEERLNESAKQLNGLRTKISKAGTR